VSPDTGAGEVILMRFGSVGGAESGQSRFIRSALLLLAVCIILISPLLIFAISGSHFHRDKLLAAKAVPHDKKTGIFTAYNSRRFQTDGTPHTTADGTNLGKSTPCVVANNHMKMGTKVQVQGLGVCVVHDRMRRGAAANHFDVYMGNSVSRAREFGRRILAYRILH
jgi:3D (Asp-Asp-Asp) domain-containing protein